MRILLTLLCLLSISSFARAEDTTEDTWEVLERCRLVNASFNDADSFSVKHQDQKYTFRLYYVDAPETNEAYPARLRDQARYFSIPEEAVTDTGKLATKFTKNFLRGEFTVYTKWEDARGGKSNKRYFALIKKDEKYLSTELMLAGLARLYGKPTKDRWPSGVTPRTFLSRLKNNERQAQREENGIWALASGSMQMSGLEALTAATEATDEIDIPDTDVSSSTPLKDRININKANSELLETLPGIGPALAARIIGARPIESIESLVQIPGISGNTLAGFSHMIITEDPPPPALTVAFYMADLEAHLNKKVTVRIASVTPSEVNSPDTFRAVTLATAHEGEDGGQITTFIPDEFYESFTNYYREPGRDFTGLLYSREGEIVLVYTRP